MTGSLFELDDYGEQMTLKLQKLDSSFHSFRYKTCSCNFSNDEKFFIKNIKKKYITTAYSKGLSKIKVIQNHALKNSLNPVITALSGWFASMLAGSVFI